MKLNVDFSALEDCVKRMGATKADFSLKLEAGCRVKNVRTSTEGVFVRFEAAFGKSRYGHVLGDDGKQWRCALTELQIRSKPTADTIAFALDTIGLNTKHAGSIISFCVGDAGEHIPEKVGSFRPTDLLKYVINRFGVPSTSETHFFRGLSHDLPIETVASSPLFAGSMENARYMSRLKNETIWNDQNTTRDDGRLLPIAQIIVPRGTKLLDPNEFGPPCTHADTRVFEGKLIATGYRGDFEHNGFSYELTEYQLSGNP